jgi:hypothetical protein
MSRRTAPSTFLLLATIAFIAACGSDTGGGIATTTASSQSSVSPAPSSAATSLALTPDRFPSGGPTLTVVSDGLLNNVPDTVQRVFANADNTYRVEDDIIIDSSATQAQSDYATWRDAAKKNVATVSSDQKPSGLGSSADEFVGTASNGHSIVAIAWANGSVLTAVLFESATTAVDQTYAEQTAAVQNDTITNNGNH